MVTGSGKVLNIYISTAKCYHSGINISLVMAHYTLGAPTCPTSPTGTGQLFLLRLPLLKIRWRVCVRVSVRVRVRSSK